MKIQRKVWAAIVLLLVVSFLFASGCSGGEAETAPGKTVIAVTIVPEQTFVEAVCGDLAEVITLVPPGSSPETYEPTPATMEQFSNAALYFAIGVPTEEANILPSAGDVEVVSLQEEVAAVYPELTFEDGERDPHIWLSPKRVIVMVETIADRVGEIDPEHEAVYRQNAEAYIEQLEALDQQIKTALAGVQDGKFVVYHPAFGYLADDYGLQMYALEEEGKESTPQHLQEMIDLARAEQIKVIFYQEEMDSSQSEAFAEELGGVTTQLAPLAADYIGNLQKMAETLAEAMQ